MEIVDVVVVDGDGELERLGKNLNYDDEVLYMDCDDDDGDVHL